MSEDVHALLPLAREIAHYWAYNRGALHLEDEYHAATVAALGEAAVRWNGKGEFRGYVVWLMNHRCNDLRRQWLIERNGRYRAKALTIEGTDHEPLVDDDDRTDRVDRDVTWPRVYEMFTRQRAIAGTDRRLYGAPLRRSYDAVAWWLEGDDQETVGGRLGVSSSRVSQMVHEVAVALRDEVAS